MAAAIVVVAFLLIRGREGDSATPLLPCDAGSSLYLEVQSVSQVFEVQREQLGHQWLETKPVAAIADQAEVDRLLQSARSLNVLNTVTQPTALAKYGLNPPRLLVACRVSSGAS